MTPPRVAIVFLALSLAPVLFAGSCGNNPRPASYDVFEVWDPSGVDSLEAAIATNTHIYVPKGHHLVDNPIVIDRSDSLFIHGGGKHRTALVASDPNEPLFEVISAGRLGIAEVSLRSENNEVFVAIDFQQSDFLRIDIQSTHVPRGTLQIAGPGGYVLQAVQIQGGQDPSSRPFDNIVLDHPSAQLYVVGGKLKNVNNANIHQKRGHLELYANLPNSQGIADVILETASPVGAHVIAGNRTEGTHDLGAESRLVYVPPTAEAVDVVVKANSFAVGTSAPSALVDYSGSGTVWVLGNVLKTNGHHLVKGDAPSSTIVALGNMLAGEGGCPPDILPINAGTEIHAYNSFDHARECGGTTHPFRRFVHPSETIAGYANVPSVPQNANGGSIPLLDMPAMGSALGDLADVTDFGAVPDDGLPDGSAIQQALDSTGRAGVYFPEGEYLVEEPLYWNHSDHLGATHSVGGRIVGAGSSVTVIRNSLGGKVFTTESMAAVGIQGLSFVTVAGDTVAAFDLNNDANVGTATRSNTFHDVVFQGGRYGLGIALNSNQQGDGTFCGDCEFRDARVGLGNGGGNALANVVHGGRFENNDINFQNGLEGFANGSIAILSAVSRSVGTMEMDPFGRNLYINDLDSDAPQLSSHGCSSAMKSVFIENSLLDPGQAVASPYMKHGVAGGYMFLSTTVSSGFQEVVCDSGVKALLSLHSDIPDFPAAEAVPPNRKEELP